MVLENRKGTGLGALPAADFVALFYAQKGGARGVEDGLGVSLGDDYPQFYFFAPLPLAPGLLPTQG